MATLLASQPSDGAKHYKEACAWYGALDVADALGDRALVERLTARYAPYLGSHRALLAGTGHVDDDVFGIVPLQFAVLGAGSAYLADGLALAEHQYAHIDAQIRFAIDDMFMITALQLQAFRATRQRKYLDLAATTMVRYLDRLQQSDGTFHHHDHVPIRWGRGNGWVASGLTELLRDLDASHPHHATVHSAYVRMMSGLRRYRIADGQRGAGLWKQVLDDKREDPNGPETSGSAMFTCAMIHGVQHGWLDAETYHPIAERAWIALVECLEPDGRLRGVSDWMWDGTVERYIARERITGDNHGQAPMLWAAAALLRGSSLEPSLDEPEAEAALRREVPGGVR